MADTKIITETKPIEYSGAAKTAERGPPVEVVVSGETGRSEIMVGGTAERLSRSAVIAKAKAKRAARPASERQSGEDGVVGSGPAGEEPSPAATDRDAGLEEARLADANPEPTGDDEDGAVGTGPAGDEEPAGDAPAAEPDPAPAAPTFDAGGELVRVRGELDEIRRSRDASREAMLETLVEEPVKALRALISEHLGVAEDDESVNELLSHVGEELTWGQIPVQDLPQDKKAQLDMARWSRQNRLTKHRRKADQGKRASEELEKRARTQAERSYGALRDKHPTLALVAEIDGRDVSDVITGTLIEAIRAGLIDPKTPAEAAYQEAIRLADSHAHQRAKNIAARFAHLAPAPAPKQPGASSQQKAPAQQSPSSAASKTPPPRALTAAKAGAAPSRPAEPAPSQPKRIVVDAGRYVDPTEQRQEVLRKHRRT